MRWSVLLTRDITESAQVNVVADTREEAEELVLNAPLESLEFETDDGYNHEAPYVTQCEEED